MSEEIKVSEQQEVEIPVSPETQEPENSAAPEILESPAPEMDPAAAEASVEESAPVEDGRESAQEEPVEEAPREGGKIDAAGLVGKSIAELSDIFKGLMDSADRMSRSKEAESIKSAFYRTLGEVRSKAGSKKRDSGCIYQETGKTGGDCQHHTGS